MPSPLLIRSIGSLLLGWSLLATAATAQVDSLFALDPDQRILRLWQMAPFVAVTNPPYLKERDSTAVFAQLDRLRDFAEQQDDDRLFWTVQLHKILFRHTLLDLREKKSTVLENAQPYMDGCPVKVVQASYWYHRGLYEFGKQRFDAGFRWLMRAQQEFDRIGYQNIPEVSEYLTGLGGPYYFFGEYATCMRYMEASLRYPYLRVRDRIGANNTIGLCYQHLNDLPKAQAYFIRTQALSQLHHDSAYAAIATTNIGHVLLLRNQPNSALPHLYRGFSLSKTLVPENAALAALYIAKALLALDSTRKAKTYIDRSTSLFKNQPWSDYDLHYYQARTQYYKKTARHQLATAYLDSTLQLQDTLRVRFNTRLLTAAQTQVNAERYLNEVRQLETQKANAVQVRNIILLALGLLSLLGGYALRQNTQKRIQEKHVLLARQQRAEELLAQYVAHLEEKNRLIETISTELDQSRTPPTEPVSRPNDASGVGKLLNRVILTEVDWQQFRQLFENVYPDFFASLLERFPDLTPAEIRLLALLKLGISTKQMAFMLGVSMNTIRTSRYRLRRKLEQQQVTTNLDAFIQQL